MRMLLVLAALSLASLPVAALAPDESSPSINVIGSQTNAESNATYWLRKREGWFWYRDPPEPSRPPKESTPSPIRPPERNTRLASASVAAMSSSGNSSSVKLR